MESGSEQHKGVTPQSMYWQNKKGGTFPKHQEKVADWCFPCRGHTHSNGLNMRAEYRQHIGGLYLHCIVNVPLLYLLLHNVL